MELCSSGHQEVCYEGRKCPACEAMAEKDGEIESLKDDIQQLQDKLNQYEQ